MILDRILALNYGFIESFGYFFVFLAAFLESTPVIGFFVPGALIVFLGGFFVKFLGHETISFSAVLLFAALGSILGDLAGYIVGRNFEKKFIHKCGKYVLLRTEHIKKTFELTENHTGKVLILGRLNSITRSFAPFIAGINKVNFWKFMLFNLIGGILWAFLFISLGYLFGHNYKFAKSFELVILIATSLLIFVIYLYYYIISLRKEFKYKNGTNSKK